MSKKWEEFDIQKPLQVTTQNELNELEQESFRETQMLIQKYGYVKAKEITDALRFKISIETFIGDMYVYQRVNAIERGIKRALAF